MEKINMFKKLLLVYLLVSFSLIGCSSKAYDLKDWVISYDGSLEDVNINMLSIKNKKKLDDYVVTLAEKDEKLSNIAVSHLVRLKNVEYIDDIGVQYFTGTSKIDFIRVNNPYDDSRKNHTHIRLYRNSNNNWVLAEFSDLSGKKLIRSVELK